MKLQLRLAPRVFANKGSTSITKSNVFVYEEVEEREQKLQFSILANGIGWLYKDTQKSDYSF